MKNISYVGTNAFENCTSLENLTIPKTIPIQEMGSSIFAGWTINQIINLGYSEVPSTWFWAWNGGNADVEHSGVTKVFFETYTDEDIDCVLVSEDAYENEFVFPVPDINTGYTFGGWYDGANGTGKKYSNQDGELIAEWDKTSKTTLYAKWIEKQYTIVYLENKPSNATAQVTGTTDESNHYYFDSDTLTANGFGLDGWAFIGWNTSADGSGTAYADGATVSELTENEEFYLHAQWQAKSYKIAYNANGGLGDMAESDHIYDSDATLSQKAYTKIGHEFLGWDTNSNATTIVYYDMAVKKNFSSSYTERIVLYAVWEKQEYIISYELNGATNNPNTLESYRYGSSYTLQTPTLTGATFAGWYTSSNFTTQVTGISATDTGHKTFHAKWTYTVSYTSNNYVSFSGNSVVVRGNNSFSVTVNTAYTQATPVVRVNGSTVSLSKSGNTYTFTVNVTSNITITVDSMAINRYMVTFTQSAYVYFYANASMFDGIMISSGMDGETYNASVPHGYTLSVSITKRISFTNSSAKIIINGVQQNFALSFNIQNITGATTVSIQI